VIPPQASAEFVCAMEDVLEVYTRPYDPARPMVCLDELSKQLEDIRHKICPSNGLQLSGDNQGAGQMNHR
jgi:hypothetical protein